MVGAVRAWRATVAVAVVAAVLAAGPGCGSGATVPPSGALVVSQGNGLKAVAWEVSSVNNPDEGVLPAIFTPETWIFVASTSGPGATIVDVLVTEPGQPQTAVAPTTGPLDIATQPGLGFFLAIDTPAVGSLIEITGTDANGNAISTNVIKTTGTNYPTENTNAGGFEVINPQDLSTNTLPFEFEWTAARTAFSYHLLVVYLDLVNGVIGFPFSIEVAPTGASSGGINNQVFDIGTGSPKFEYAYDPDPNNDYGLPPLVGFQQGLETYTFVVVPIDNSGWGIGTTVDVPGYNAALAGGPTGPFATWPWWNTQ